MALTLKDRMTLALLGVLPQNQLSRSVGWVLSRPLPTALRAPIYGAFARRYGVNLSEAERELVEYPTFDEFFTRRLKAGLRPTSGRPLVSPVDGVVSQFGRIEDGKLVQAKGRSYRVEDLLGEAREAQAFMGGQFLTIYLSPRDYHRIHAPVDGSISGYIYMPGRLWPVNPAAVETIDGLFAQNERISTLLQSSLGKVAVVKVGATCVGSISLAYDKLRSNRAGARSAVRSFAQPPSVARLDELGAFHMGSTVILLLSPAAPPLISLQEGQPLRLGEGLC